MARRHLEARGRRWLNTEVTQGMGKENPGPVSCSPSPAMLACHIETVG